MAAPPAYDPAELPVGPPPPGVQSNFASPVSRASDIVIAGATCLSLVTLFAALRLYAKLAVMKTRTWDDCNDSTYKWLLVIFTDIRSDMYPWHCEMSHSL